MNTLTLSTAERKRADGADTLERDGMEEFMAVIRECVEESEECTNLIRKMQLRITDAKCHQSSVCGHLPEQAATRGKCH